MLRQSELFQDEPFLKSFRHVLESARLSAPHEAVILARRTKLLDFPVRIVAVLLRAREGRMEDPGRNRGLAHVTWADCREPYRRNLDGSASMWIHEMISTTELALDLWDLWAMKRDYEPKQAGPTVILRRNDPIDAQIEVLIDAMRMAKESTREIVVSSPDERLRFLKASLANHGRPDPSGESRIMAQTREHQRSQEVTWADCREPYRRDLDGLATMWIKEHVSTRQLALELWKLWARKRDAEPSTAGPTVNLRRNDRVDSQIEILAEAVRMAARREEEVEYTLPEERREFLQAAQGRFRRGGEELQR